MDKSLSPTNSFVDLCTLHQHAMRYYRIWIYACNTTLAIATGIFILFAVSVMVDPRFQLLSSISLYQPSLIYAYLALFIQCGIVQTIGCLGAVRLNQKFLNAYWMILFLLVIGDLILGLIWAFKLDEIKSNLKSNLNVKLRTEYSVDEDFTQLWDWVQTTDQCCGIEGLDDWGADLNATIPLSCCSATSTPTSPTSKVTKQRPLNLNSQTNQQTTTTALTRRRLQLARRLPPEGAVVSVALTSSVTGRSSDVTGGDIVPGHSNNTGLGSINTTNHSSIVTGIFSNTGNSTIPSNLTLSPHSPYPPCPSPNSHLSPTGCHDKIILWLNKSTDLLFVLGFCIIVFIKTCFLVILRYEIREMIEKIGLLNDRKGRAKINEMIGLTSSNGDSNGNNNVIK